jgi:hypothetical protein
MSAGYIYRLLRLGKEHLANRFLILVLTLTRDDTIDTDALCCTVFK